MYASWGGDINMVWWCIGGGIVIFCIGFLAGCVFHYWIIYPVLHDDEHIMSFHKGADNGTLGPDD
jgi:hypothetical protein